MRLTDLKPQDGKAQIWRMVLFPALGVTLILATGLTYLYWTQFNHMVSQRGSALSETLAELSTNTRVRNNRELLHAMVNAVLTDPSIRAATLHLEESNLTLHSGPRMLPLRHAEPIDRHQPQQRQTSESIRFVHPIPAPGGATSPGWVEVELLASPFAALRYQALLLMLLMTLFCVALCAWFSYRHATRLYRQLSNPSTPQADEERREAFSPQPPAPGPSAVAPPEPSTDTQRPPAARILVVDDNSANRRLACELLRSLRTEAVVANSGAQALELCRQQAFDLIFMDIQMPKMDGIETTRQLRQVESRQRTPIIALTADSMIEQKAELLVAGLDDCLSKPVSESQLASIIDRWIPAIARYADHHPARYNGSNALPNPSPANDLEEEAAPPPVDVPLSLKLANHKPTLARDLLEMLLHSLERERDAINQAFAARDYPQLETLIHRLHGSCCYCGVPRLKRVSKRMNKMLQTQQYDQLAGPINTLNTAVEEIVRWSASKDINALFCGVPTACYRPTANRSHFAS